MKRVGRQMFSLFRRKNKLMISPRILALEANSSPLTQALTCGDLTLNISNMPTQSLQFNCFIDFSKLEEICLKKRAFQETPNLNLKKLAAFFMTEKSMFANNY